MRRLLMLCCLTLTAGPALAQIDTAPDIRNYNVSGSPILGYGPIPDLHLNDVWGPAATEPGDVPAYLTIVNTGAADQLIGATCTDAQGTTLNETNPKKQKNPGLLPMGTKDNPILEQIPIPANSTVVLKPGGLHLVLQDMAYPPPAGERIACTLQFEETGPRDVVLRIRNADTNPPHASPG